MNAELLIMFALGCDRAHLYAHPERELTSGETQRYDVALAQRATGMPAQYITGHQEFWGLDFVVSAAVLIPRPETEHLVEIVLELALGGQEQDQQQLPKELQNQEQQQQQRPGTRASALHGVRIVDVGTGSGAIALALATELTTAEIYATDISTDALEVARANTARHELTSRIQFHQADLLSGLLNREFDFVISNPPYVGDSEEDTVQLEVRKFEPRNAVFAGPTGLEVIERLIPQAYEALRPGGWLVFEISGTIADRVRNLLSNWDEVEIRNDLQGIARVAIARRPSENA
jgi:release factor glutamine methyltransferase